MIYSNCLLTFEMPLNIVNNILSFEGFVQSFNGIQKYS